MLRLVIVVAASTLTCACASNPYLRMKDGAHVTMDGSALVVFSQIKDGGMDEHWSFVLRPYGQLQGFGVGREFRLPNGFYEMPCQRLGSVWMMRLKPGNYQFGPWFIPGMAPVLDELVIAPLNRRTRSPGIATFTARANELLYLGEISIKGYENRAQVTDRWECDQQYLQSTWPGFNQFEVRRDIAVFDLQDSAQ